MWNQSNKIAAQQQKAQPLYPKPPKKRQQGRGIEPKTKESIQPQSKQKSKQENR